MERRRSVAETIAWRFPSARARPGAGYLPILAPGRLRARLRWKGGTLVTLWRRAPRQVYRVYGEDEYLSEGGTHVSDQHSRSPIHDEDSPPFIDGGSERSRSGRLIGLGLLVGVTVGAAGLVVVNASRPHGASSSGVVRRGPASVASHPQATASAKHSAVARRRAFGVQRSRDHAGARPHVHPSRGRRSHSGTEQLAPVQILRSIQTSKVWTSTSGGPATLTGGEFDFER